MGYWKIYGFSLMVFYSFVVANGLNKADVCLLQRGVESAGAMNGITDYGYRYVR